MCSSDLDFFPRQTVIADISEILIIGLSKIRRRHHRFYAGECKRRARVDGLDARMGMGATKNAAMKHARRGNISPVGRFSGDLVPSIRPGKTSPNDFEVALDWVVNIHGSVPPHFSGSGLHCFDDFVVTRAAA